MNTFRACIVGAIATLAGGTAGAAGGDGAWVCTGTDAASYVTNEPDRDTCVALAEPAPGAKAPEIQDSGTPQSGSAETPAPSEAADSVARTSKASRPIPPGEDPNTPPLDQRLQNYRDAMLQGAAGSDAAPPAATNPAVNRRYLMINRAGFQGTH